MNMMSDRTGRAWRTSWEGALDREAEAMIEAKRILAATGPGWLTLTAHPCYGGRALTGYPSVFAVLAESLGAAVADGGLLDQMAGGAR